MSRLSHWIGNVALATDIEINAITGGESAADPQGTISLRAAVARRDGRGWRRRLGAVMCALLAWMFRTDHCGNCLREAAERHQRI